MPAVVGVLGLALAFQHPVLAGPSAADGNDILINVPAQDTLPNCNTQNEVTLARWGNRLLAGWNDGQRCDLMAADGVLPGLSLNGFAWSEDGGRIWDDRGTIRAPDGGSLLGDPVVAADAEGTFYYASLMADPACCRIGVARWDDDRDAWSSPVPAGSAPSPGGWHDKPWIAVDTSDSEYRGTLYAAWTEVIDVDPPADDTGAILMSRSTDGGKSWAPSINLTSGWNLERHIGTQVAVGPDGEVYIVWSVVGNDLRFVRSLDGGQTFTTQRSIAQVKAPGHDRACLPGGTVRKVLHGDVRVLPFPSLAVDVSGSSDPQSIDFNPHRGNVYVAVTHDGNGVQALSEAFPSNEADIALFSSVDRGDTWRNVGANRLALVLVNDDGGNDDDGNTDQFNPQVAVNDNGDVAVSWYDRRNSAGGSDDPLGPNWSMELYAAVSTDGGQGFGANFSVSDTMFPPARTNPQTNGFSGCYMAEYNGLVGAEEEFLVAWGDNRDGHWTLPDPNVYFDNFKVSP